MVAILIAAVAIAMIWVGIKYFPIVCAKPNPRLDADVRRIKWIEKRISQSGGASARHMSNLRSAYGAEYDAILQAGQQPPIP